MKIFPTEFKGIHSIASYSVSFCRLCQKTLRKTLINWDNFETGCLERSTSASVWRFFLPGSEPRQVRAITAALLEFSRLMEMKGPGGARSRLRPQKKGHDVVSNQYMLAWDAKASVWNTWNQNVSLKKITGHQGADAVPFSAPRERRGAKMSPRLQDQATELLSQRLSFPWRARALGPGPAKYGCEAGRGQLLPRPSFCQDPGAHPGGRVEQAQKQAPSRPALKGAQATSTLRTALRFWQLSAVLTMTAIIG